MTYPESEQANTGPAATELREEARSADARSGPNFAHASEAELARILDFYAVAWEYEPHRFPILWNLDGAVVESFSPDFYLPDLDLYLEMTTLRQRLVRKKNRKLRRLRELYPDVRIKLFYARDFRALMLKYGKLALVGALSGTSGQVGPIRDVAVIIGDELPEAAPPGAADVSPPHPPVALPSAATVAPRPELAAASPAAARVGARRRTDGVRRPARRPVRPERPGSAR
jgi:hypoxanthine phosphoribosyltransferase